MQIPEGQLPDGTKVEASTPASFKTGLKDFKLQLSGHAIECRMCAEDPCHDLCPARCAYAVLLAALHALVPCWIAWHVYLMCTTGGVFVLNFVTLYRACTCDSDAGLPQ